MEKKFPHESRGNKSKASNTIFKIIKVIPKIEIKTYLDNQPSPKLV